VLLAKRLFIAITASLAVWRLATLTPILLEAEASNLALTLRLLGIHTLRIGRTVYLEGPEGTAGFRIEWHCSGLVMYTVFISAATVLLAHRPRRLLHWMLTGFLALYMVNILRMTMILLTYRVLGASAAVDVHTWAAPAVMVSATTALAASMLADAGVRTRATYRG